MMMPTGDKTSIEGYGVVLFCFVFCLCVKCATHDRENRGFKGVTEHTFDVQESLTKVYARKISGDGDR